MNTPLNAPSSLAILAMIEDFIAKNPDERIPVRALVDHTGEDGLLFILFVFALFCALPIPIPGIHVFLSMPLYYVTVQQMMGRKKIWFPEKILTYTLPRSGFVAMVTHARPWMARLETYMKPRAQFLTSHHAYRVMGAVALFITCIIVIPLPLTNVVPALSIALIALGMMCRDGVATLVGCATGLLWCVAWIVLAAVIGWAGMKGIYTLVFG